MSANTFKFPPPPPPPPAAQSTSPNLDRQRNGQRNFASRGRKGPTNQVSRRSASRVEKQPHKNLSGRQQHREWLPPDLAQRQAHGSNLDSTSTQARSMAFEASVRPLSTGLGPSTQTQDQAEDPRVSGHGQRDGNILGLTPQSFHQDLEKSTGLAPGALGTEEASLPAFPVERDEDGSILDIPLAFKGRSLDLKSPEDVRQWLEERRRRFPKSSNNLPEISIKAGDNLGTATTSLKANVAGIKGKDNASDAMAHEIAPEERPSLDGDSSDESTNYTSSSGSSSENVELPEQISSKSDPTPAKHRAETAPKAFNKTLCRTFVRKGSCAYGQRCKFRHSDDAKASASHVIPKARSAASTSKPARQVRLYEKLVRQEQDAEDRKIVAAIISLGQKGVLAEPG